jgi:hypothetical protein
MVVYTIQKVFQDRFLRIEGAKASKQSHNTKYVEEDFTT